MPISDRSKRFGLSEDAQNAERPEIWIEGRQRPRFDLRAYAATALGMAKRDLPPEILDAEGRLRGFGQRVVTGELRPDLAWMGRLQNAVPSHQRVGGWLLGLASLFADTRALLLPGEEKDAVLAHPNLLRGRVSLSEVKPSRPPEIPGAQRPRSTVEPTLHAIRSAIGPTPHDASLEVRGRQPHPHAAGPHVKAGKAGDGKATVGFLKKTLWRAACWSLLGILMGFAIPGGAVRALLYHLDGGDLADWS